MSIVLCNLVLLLAKSVYGGIRCSKLYEVLRYFRATVWNNFAIRILYSGDEVHDNGKQLHQII